MPSNCDISRSILAAQELMFRVATDPMRGGVPLKVIAHASGIPYGTLRTYAAGTMMPVSALAMLSGVIRDDLLSMLLPGNRMIVNAPDDVDHDTLAALCIEFAAEHARARHPDSPGGVEITATEGHGLDQKAAKLQQENCK